MKRVAGWLILFIAVGMIIPGLTLIPPCGYESLREKSGVAFGDQNSLNRGSEPSASQNVYKVTFIELGSDRCIPCRQMKPVMEDIEREYGGQVRVIFYDVWTPEGRPMASKYRIRLIPTQVFLDEDGNEFFRHEGFFPKEDIVNVLKKKGVR